VRTDAEGTRPESRNGEPGRIERIVFARDVLESALSRISPIAACSPMKATGPPATVSPIVCRTVCPATGSAIDAPAVTPCTAPALIAVSVSTPLSARRRPSVMPSSTPNPTGASGPGQRVGAALRDDLANAVHDLRGGAGRRRIDVERAHLLAELARRLRLLEYPIDRFLFLASSVKAKALRRPRAGSRPSAPPSARLLDGLLTAVPIPEKSPGSFFGSCARGRGLELERALDVFAVQGIEHQRFSSEIANGRPSGTRDDPVPTWIA